MSSHCYCIVLPKPLILLVRSVDRVWFGLSKALYSFGLVSSSGSLLAPSWNHVYMLPSMDLQSPTAPATSMKAKLPAVKYSMLIERSASQEAEAICAICLVGLEEKDEVRELGNCSHAFHKECMDQWVELGHVTCPLCRSEIFPTKNQSATTATRSLFLSFARRV